MPPDSSLSKPELDFSVSASRRGAARGLLSESDAAYRSPGSRPPPLLPPRAAKVGPSGGSAYRRTQIQVGGKESGTGLGPRQPSELLVNSAATARQHWRRMPSAALFTSSNEEQMP